MNRLKKPLKTLGLLIYAIGILVGMALTGSTVVADVEATFYGFMTFTNTPLHSLRCPVFVTPIGTNTVKASVTNRTDLISKPAMRVDFSNPGPLITEQTRLDLQPGETQKFEWTVSQENVDLQNFIFVNVLVYASYDNPARQSTCGMIFLDLPWIPGWLLFTSLALIFGLFTVAGYLLWEKNSRPLTNQAIDQSRGMRFLGGLVLAGIATSFMGWWLVGGGLFAIAILMVGAMMYLLVQRSEI